ncbi:MAG: DUF6263 family protein [Armatimonadota bacterium]|nr:DUF6263 family protein [Armatimonadota bacterium]
MNKMNLLAAAILLTACPAALSADSAAPPPAVPTAPALTAPVTPVTPAVTLRLKFTPGQTLYYTMTVDTDGMMQMGQTGAGMPLKNHMTMLIRQAVKDVRASDGAATIDTGIDSMTMAVNGQTFPMPPDQLAKMKSVGTLVILPTGKTLSFTPNPALANSGAMPGMSMNQANPFGTMGQFPDAPVKAGDTWKSALNMGMMGMQATSGFTLTGVDTTGGKTVALIAQTMTGTFDMAGGKSAAPTGMKMLEKVAGTGTLHFDVDAGAIESQTSQSNVTMSITPQGATAPMQMQMKATTTMQRTTAPAPPSAAAVQ